MLRRGPFVAPLESSYGKELHPMWQGLRWVLLVGKRQRTLAASRLCWSEPGKNPAGRKHSSNAIQVGIDLYLDLCRVVSDHDHRGWHALEAFLAFCSARSFVGLAMAL